MSRAIVSQYSLIKTQIAVTDMSSAADLADNWKPGWRASEYLNAKSLAGNNSSITAQFQSVAAVWVYDSALSWTYSMKRLENHL